MATCNPSDLVQAGKCFMALPPNQREAIQTVLLCRILKASNPMAACDPSTLMADAKCFASLPPNQLQAIQTQLLCEILQGGATGETCIVCVDGDEPPTEISTCDCALAYNMQGQFWAWNSTTFTWFPIIL